MDSSGTTNVVNAGPGVTTAGNATIVGNDVPLNLLPPTVVNLTSIAPITLGLGAEVTGSVRDGPLPLLTRLPGDRSRRQPGHHRADVES
jgi:hypothetical protein